MIIGSLGQITKKTRNHTKFFDRKDLIQVIDNLTLTDEEETCPSLVVKDHSSLGHILHLAPRLGCLPCSICCIVGHLSV